MRSLPLFSLLVLSFFATTAGASSVIVPDQFASIQGAIDSGADSVLVREGTYAESLYISRPVALISILTQGFPGGFVGPRMAVPRVTKLLSHNPGNTVLIRNFSFTGPVKFEGSGEIFVEGCLFGAGLDCRTASRGHIWNNIVFGNLTFISGGSPDIAMNTVISGSLVTNSVGTSWTHDNAVVGPAPVGIQVGSDMYAVHNHVRNCTRGISLGAEDSGAMDNVVEDCSGMGIGTLSPANTDLTGNTVRRCGVGLDLILKAGSTGIRDNIVENSATDGIRVTGVFSGAPRITGNTIRSSGGNGVITSMSPWNVIGNQVIGSALDGIGITASVEFPTQIQRNIVGRSGGRGIALTGGHGALHGNTVYLNGAAGFDFTGDSSDSIDNNIAYQNDVGVHWSGAQPLLGCNDWFDNAAGNTIGLTEAPSDTSLDPQFCDLLNDDVSLSALSPLASLGDCGLVGALGIGCSGTTAVTGRPRFTSGLEIFPVPAGSSVSFAWKPLGVEAELTLYDISGALRRRESLGPEVGAIRWRAEDGNGRRLPPGVYLVRLRAPGLERAGRLIVTP